MTTPQDFPTLCETCLGDDPYVRMARQENGMACKICTRPMTSYRWKAGSGRFKSTVVCGHCAKMKNLCQTCLLDLEFGLPIQLRDKYLAENEQVVMPTSKIGRLYQAEHYKTLVEHGGVKAIENSYGKLSTLPSVKKLARNAPYYKRNEVKICNFYVKGICSRGELCPFRHEMPEKSELATESITDRFHGRNDPVAEKIAQSSK